MTAAVQESVEKARPGAVDGYARIKGDHGFVFLFNGDPRAAKITFEVGDEINLQIKGDYQFTGEKFVRELDAWRARLWLPPAAIAGVEALALGPGSGKTG